MTQPSSSISAGSRRGHFRERSDASIRINDGNSSTAHSSRRGTASADVQENSSPLFSGPGIWDTSPEDKEDHREQKQPLRLHAKADRSYHNQQYREKSGATASSSSSQQREGPEAQQDEEFKR